MSLSTFLLLSTIQGYLPVALYLMALYRWKKISHISRVTAWYLISCSAAHFLVVYIFSLKVIKNGNNVTGNLFTFIEVAFLLAIFAIAFGSKKITRTLAILTIAFWVFGALNAAFLQPLNTINSNPLALGNVLLMGSSIYYFYSLLRNMPTQNLTQYPMFWIATAILIYSAGSFVTYVVTEYMIVLMQNEFMYVWSFKNCLRSLFFLLIGIGILKDNTRQTDLV
jgi:hypothetical protein